MLGRLADLVSWRPGVVVLVAVLIAAAASTRVLKLEVTTSRTNLARAVTESEKQFGVFLDEFGSPNDLTAVVDGTGEVELRAVADELAAELARRRDLVRSTFHKVEIDWFLDSILLFVPADELGAIRRALESSFADDIRQGRVEGLDGVVDELTAAFTSRAPQPGMAMDPARITAGLAALRTIMAELDRRLRDPEREGLEGFRELIPPLRAGSIDDHGYLQSRDGGLRVLFARPASRSDENAVVLPLVEEVRAIAAGIAARHPGSRVRVTGLPALQADETVIVDRDVFLTTVISLIAITIVLLYGYRKPQQVLLSLVPLGIGTLWTLAAVQLTYGHINIVASAFMPILLGRGSDFAIYIVARYNAARGAGKPAREAVREAVVAAGGGIVTGALITAAAFLVSTLGQFGAFSQLAVVVGVGLVLVLIASLLVTPALLLLVGDRRLPGEQHAERIFDELPAFGAGPGGVALRHPGTALGVAAAAVIVLGALARSVPVDYDLLKFLPAGAESVTAQHDLSARSDYGADVIVVMVPSVEEARAKAAELAAKPNVGRVESIASFLPGDQPVKLERIREMRGLVETIPPFRPPDPPTRPERFAAALQRLVDTVDDKVFLAEQAVAGDEKLRPVVANLKGLGEQAEAALKTLGALPEVEAAKRVANIEAQVYFLLVYSRQLLRDNVLDAKEVRIDDLPEATRERFVGRTGRIAIYGFPRRAGAGDELAAFVADVRAVAPQATGFPLIYFDTSRAIKRSFVRAAFQALVVIVFALLLHFRRPLAAGLALVPLALGSIAMFGLMRIFSIENNMANIVALPLLLGLGTDYGLQLVHHYRTVADEPLGAVLQKTGPGVFMAGGTTAAGFGALALARHKGGASLGLVLFLGTSVALLCSLVVLPALLVFVDRRGALKRGA